MPIDKNFGVDVERAGTKRLHNRHGGQQRKPRLRGAVELCKPLYAHAPHSREQSQ